MSFLSLGLHISMRPSNVTGSGSVPPLGGLAELLIQFEDGTGGTLPHRIYSLPVGDEAQPIELAIADTEHTLTGLDWNTEHTVDIYSFDDPDESIALTVDIWTAPEDAPSLAAAATGENTMDVTLTMNGTPPASTGGYYSLERKTGIGGTYAEIEQIAKASLTGSPLTYVYGDTLLAGNTTYYYQVRSVNVNPLLGLPPPNDNETHDPGYSAYSTAVNETTDADVTGPTNSAVSATAGDTVADLAATSSETGTRYWYVSTSATPPSQGDLVAGTGAVYASNEACTAAVSATQQATGLTNGVTYYLHTNAKDASNNFSTIATTAGFAPLPSGTPWNPTPNSRSNRNNYTGWVGAYITVASTITVTDLGRIFRTGNANSHDVAIYNAAYSLLVSTSVNCASGTNGAYNYAACTPTVLTAGSYYILQKETSGGDTWGDDGTAQSSLTAVASIAQSAYRSADSGAIEVYVANGMGVPTFKYTT